MSKRALLIGSSFSSAPIFARMKARGLFVAVCGKYQTDPCHQYADESHYIDYSDREALLEVVQRAGFDYIVSSCNDYAYISGAWVATQTGHVGFDPFPIAETLHTKALFRRLTHDLGVPAPEMRLVDEENAAAPDFFPLLVKPVDSFSGQGMTKVIDPAELAPALALARANSRSGAIVVEQFVDGALHSHSAFVAGGAIVADFFVDEFCTAYPYQVDCSHHPSLLPQRIREGVRRSMEKIVAHLGLVDGLLHTQFMSAGDDYWIIETMRRCPGDLYGGLIERSLGVDYTDRYLAGFLGEAPSEAARDRPAKFVGRHTLSVAAPVAVHGYAMRFPGRLTSVVALKNSGEILGPAPRDKLAIVFNDFDSFDDMARVVPRMADLVDIEPVDGKRILD
jgi:formate-dependent phosphoribosylglycinamide formyltransferase (GAR transformylase)